MIWNWNPNVLPWWGWFLVGGALWFVFQNFILPDAWSTWLALRKNGLTAVLPFAILALIVGFGNLFVALGLAMWAALQQTAIAPWVWWLAIVGTVLVLLYFWTRRLQKRPAPKPSVAKA